VLSKTWVFVCCLSSENDFREDSDEKIKFLMSRRMPHSRVVAVIRAGFISILPTNF
jgi:hypothetical protein